MKYREATTFVTPVVAINGLQIGERKPEPITQKLRHIYIEELLKI